MASITFDTHEFIKTLEEAGFDEKQAEAVARAFKTAQHEAEVATKSDIERLELKLEGEMKLVKWMLAVVIAAEVIPLLGKFFS